VDASSFFSVAALEAKRPSPMTPTSRTLALRSGASPTPAARQAFFPFARRAVARPPAVTMRDGKPLIRYDAVVLPRG
jgi:hypothetical protein